MIEKYLVDKNEANEADGELPDPEFIMCPLDMIASLFYAFGNFLLLLLLLLLFSN